MTTEPRQGKESTSDRVPMSALDQSTIDEAVEDVTPQMPLVTEKANSR